MIHVLGSINLDYSCTVELLPRPGETILGRSLQTTPGGKGANQAIAARRAGASVHMAGAVGADETAAQAMAFLHSDGVDISQVLAVEAPTGCAFVFVDASSENQIVIVTGANAEVSASQASTLPMNAKDVLLLQLEVPTDAVIAAAQAAQQHGTTVIANLAPYQTLPESFYESVDIILVNETEASLLAKDFNINPEQDNIASHLAHYLKKIVVLTLGANGVVVAAMDQETAIAGVQVAAVDTVGAGDTFAGYLGAMLEQGHSLHKACEIANCAAAKACTKPGAQTAIPRLDEIDISGL